MTINEGPHHDHCYTRLFSQREMERDQLVQCVCEDWVRQVDLDTQETVKGSFVNDDLRERQDDIIWRLRLPDINDFQEVHAVLQERVEPWNQQIPETGRQLGRQEGRQEGRMEGEARVLGRQLPHRSGPLPNWADQRLAAATEAKLEASTDDAVLVTMSLAEVIAPPSVKH